MFGRIIYGGVSAASVIAERGRESACAAGVPMALRSEAIARALRARGSERNEQPGTPRRPRADARP